MPTDPYAWRARTFDDFGNPDIVRVFLFRYDGTGDRVTVKSISDTAVQIERTAPETVHEFAGLSVPRGVLEAIAGEVKPGPTAAEVARLEEALTVERARVDAFLARAQVSPA